MAEIKMSYSIFTFSELFIRDATNLRIFLMSCCICINASIIFIEFLLFERFVDLYHYLKDKNAVNLDKMEKESSNTNKNDILCQDAKNLSINNGQEDFLLCVNI